MSDGRPALYCYTCGKTTHNTAAHTLFAPPPPQFASDEPRLCRECGGAHHERECPLLDDEACRTREFVRRDESREDLLVRGVPASYVDVVVAVLAEVARQDAGIPIEGPYAGDYANQISEAALAIREALRLSKEGK